MATSKKTESIDIIAVEKRSMTVRMVGTSPYICNAMSAKTRQQLLLPPQKKNAAQKASSLKHNPFQEYRDSIYSNLDDDSSTLIQALSAAVKGAMKSAALDIPGATKAQISRLVWVEGERVELFGVPRLLMAVTRSADIARTPDVRTRAILPEWACEVTVSYSHPIMKDRTVLNLLASAGIMQGIGDWRIGKGAGSYGGFELVSEGDPRWEHITSTGGRAAQLEAMENPVCHDDETAKLLSWFESEAESRGFEVAA